MSSRVPPLTEWRDNRTIRTGVPPLTGGREGGHWMRRFLWAVAGLVGGYVVALFGIFTLGDLLGVSQAEGAFAMGVAFFWAPLCAVICAILGAIYGGRTGKG